MRESNLKKGKRCAPREDLPAKEIGESAHRPRRRRLRGGLRPLLNDHFGKGGPGTKGKLIHIFHLLRVTGGK